MPASESPAVTAVVLAGGLSRRMGHDKGLVSWRNKPLIAHVLEIVEPQADHMFINTPNPDYNRFGHPLLPDALPGRLGPLAGILAALETVREGWALTVPCDTPHLPPDLRVRLTEALEGEEVELAVAADGERLHPVIALLRPDLAPDLRTWLECGKRRVDDWVRSHRYAAVKFEPAVLANFNTAADLENS